MSDAAFGWLFVAAVLLTAIGLMWAYRSSSRTSREPDDDEPVAIGSGAEGEVVIMATKLEAAGIKALTRPRYPSRYANPIYGSELLVRYGDQEGARRILKLDES